MILPPVISLTQQPQQTVATVPNDDASTQQTEHSIHLLVLKIRAKKALIAFLLSNIKIP